MFIYEGLINYLIQLLVKLLYLRATISYNTHIFTSLLQQASKEGINTCTCTCMYKYCTTTWVNFFALHHIATRIYANLHIASTCSY